jgi:hypothetical protein
MNKRGRRGVNYTDVLLPPGAAFCLRERARLWNEIERLEGHKDAQFSREINLALPHELDADASLAAITFDHAHRGRALMSNIFRTTSAPSLITR